MFGTKRGELGFSFKTLPGKEITRLELGGAIGAFSKKIFLTCLWFGPTHINLIYIE